MIDEKEIEQAFARAMERGGPKAPDRIVECRKALYKAFDEYLEEVERVYFSWGYRQALEDMNALKDE